LLCEKKICNESAYELACCLKDFFLMEMSLNLLKI